MLLPSGCWSGNCLKIPGKLCQAMACSHRLGMLLFRVQRLPVQIFRWRQ